jgi:hypothetical protein
VAALLLASRLGPGWLPAALGLACLAEEPGVEDAAAIAARADTALEAAARTAAVVRASCEGGVERGEKGAGAWE